MNNPTIQELEAELAELYRGRSTDTVRIGKLWNKIEEMLKDE